jgi:zinc-ribbon domain
LVVDKGITRELSLGEVVSKTLGLYRRNFAEYFVLYLVVEAVIGAVSTLAYNAFVLPSLPANPTAQQVANWFPGFAGTLAELVVAVGVVSLVFGTIAFGGTVKMASEEVENRSIDLGGAVKFAATKLLWMWVLGLLLGVIIVLGFIALIVPGIILAIMFSLAFQALLIEGAGITGSMSRSRELVGHRWLKTFATFLVFVIIIGIASSVVSAISAPFGDASRLVSSVLSAFYQPILPVATTIYFYSNRARISPVQPSQTAMPAPGMKFCTNCGTQLEASVTFCSKCGAKQPT